MKMTWLPWIEKIWKLMAMILLSLQETSKEFSIKGDSEKEDLATHFQISSTMLETKEIKRPTKSKLTNVFNVASLDTT